MFSTAMATVAGTVAVDTAADMAIAAMAARALGPALVADTLVTAEGADTAMAMIVAMDGAGSTKNMASCGNAGRPKT